MFRSNERYHIPNPEQRDINKKSLACAREEDSRIELPEFETAEDATAHADAYIAQMGNQEREALFHAIEETSVWLDCVDNIEKVFFLDASIRPLVPILHAYRKKHHKSWPKNQFLPIGREIRVATQAEREKAVSKVQGIEEGPIYIIDEFAYSGHTLADTAEAISHVFGLLPDEIHTHAITDANTANGLFVRPRPGSPHDDGMQWEQHDISFRFPVQRITNVETGSIESVRIDAYSLPHTTSRLVHLAKEYIVRPVALQRDTYLLERTKQANLDRVFYRAYVDGLRQAILSYDTE
jgi:hypothetical protein